MTYTITIDQEFAEINGLTLVEVSTLAAFMTLPIWAKTIAVDGVVWYKYSDEKMAEDFPLLFGVAKRCYKNAVELANRGFLELTKVGGVKYVRFTERCADWEKVKGISQQTESPKTDCESENGLIKSEIGLKNSPKTDSNYNINNNQDIINNIYNKAENEKAAKTKGTADACMCLFVNSRFAKFEDFAAQFKSPEYTNVDIAYYYYAVADWSAQRGKKMKDWIATARNFIRRDAENKKLHKLQSAGLTADALDYLKEMA